MTQSTPIHSLQTILFIYIMKKTNSNIKQNLQIALILTFALTCTGAVALSSKFRNEIYSDLHNLEGCLIGSPDDYSDKFPGIDEYHFESTNFDRSPRAINTTTGHSTFNPAESYSESNPLRTYRPSIADNESQPGVSSAPTSIYATSNKEEEDNHSMVGTNSVILPMSSETKKPDSKKANGLSAGLLASNDEMPRPFSGSLEKVSLQNSTNLVPPSGDPDMNEAVPVGDTFETLLIFIGLYSIVKFYTSINNLRKRI